MSKSDILFLHDYMNKNERRCWTPDICKKLQKGRADLGCMAAAYVEDRLATAQRGYPNDPSSAAALGATVSYVAPKCDSLELFFKLQEATQFLQKKARNED